MGLETLWFSEVVDGVWPLAACFKASVFTDAVLDTGFRRIFRRIFRIVAMPLTGSFPLGGSGGAMTTQEESEV